MGRLGCSVAALVALMACAAERRSPAGTVVVAAVGEPESILPPIAYETVARDIGDLVYERLATLAPGGAPVDTAAFQPGLADRWERADPLTWRFHLRPGARWHDGTAVTADDVVFSFEAYADTVLAAAAQYAIAGRISATAVDDSTVLVRLTAPSAEPLYDATWHVRILPRHIWQSVPRERWAGDTRLARLVGSGPYRVSEWQRGMSITLDADTLRADSLQPNIARVVWRFTADPDAALNLVLSGEADLLESIGAPDRIARVAADSTLRVVRYPSAVYGFAAFRIGQGERSHLLFAERALRRALAMAIDRSAIAENLYGADAVVPAGPMSALLWVRHRGRLVVPYAPDEGARALDAAGWRAGRDGVRSKEGRRLAFEILVPSSSPSRRQAGIAMQEMWRQVGAAAEVTAVEFPVFQERLARGDFDVYVGAYLDEPSARGLADQWGTDGIGVLNHAGYSNPVLDSLLDAAARAGSRAAARDLYHEALDTLDTDAVAIYLYSPIQAAAIRKEIDQVTIDPYSWLARFPEWTVAPARPEPK
jgi:peptide/nickel transport system substrate-binding protein